MQSRAAEGACGRFGAPHRYFATKTCTHRMTCVHLALEKMQNQRLKVSKLFCPNLSMRHCMSDFCVRKVDNIRMVLRITIWTEVMILQMIWLIRITNVMIMDANNNDPVKIKTMVKICCDGKDYCNTEVKIKKSSHCISSLSGVAETHAGRILSCICVGSNRR